MACVTSSAVCQEPRSDRCLEQQLGFGGTLRQLALGPSTRDSCVPGDLDKAPSSSRLGCSLLPELLLLLAWLMRACISIIIPAQPPGPQELLPRGEKGRSPL